VRNLGIFLKRERLGPEYVVSALRRIDPHVRRALVAAELTVDYTSLPFPSRRSTAASRDGLEAVFGRLLESARSHSR